MAMGRPLTRRVAEHGFAMSSASRRLRERGNGGAPKGAFGACSSNGWIDEELFL